MKTKPGPRIAKFPTTRSELEMIPADRLELMRDAAERPPYLAIWIEHELAIRYSRAPSGTPNTPNGRPPKRAS